MAELYRDALAEIERFEYEQPVTFTVSRKEMAILTRAMAEHVGATGWCQRPPAARAAIMWFAARDGS